MKNKFGIGVFAIVLFVLLTGVFVHSYGAHAGSMDEMREDFVEMKNDMIKEMIHDGDYACCLETPCTYCIEKTPGHGEGATCNCLEDVVEGRHPCGECIGEIMEGHGNKFLAKFFARSIAEEMGEQYHQVLKEMMFDKYIISVDDQL